MGLAIGIVCASLILLWVEDELNFNKVNTKKKFLYQVYQNQTPKGNFLTTPRNTRPACASIEK